MPSYMYGHLFSNAASRTSWKYKSHTNRTPFTTQLMTNQSFPEVPPTGVPSDAVLKVNWVKNEYYYVQQALTLLKDVIARESKRHEMDQYLTPSMYAMLDDEIIPMLENELDYEPSDADLGCGSEPPMTMDEMYKKAVEEKRIAWS